ncbi:MAG: 16S rRNA (cytosine(1402)-N(4))-methyltransferase RsmH [Bdellovibrionales bacterium]|nr:16S rRNA (cytosine(1402)-N(4))-methyltransferase RsmH [Bdellovibrionales bacterium]
MKPLTNDTIRHRPVLAREVLLWAEGVGEPSLLLDGTLGSGGHSELLLTRFRNAFLIGLDRDRAAVARAAKRLEPFSERIFLKQRSFATIADLASDLPEQVRARRGALCPSEHLLFDCVVLDLGISSDQLDDPSRGFSFMHDGPLDMRMDLTQEASAATLLNEASVQDLARLFRQGGVGPLSRALAAEIFSQRPVASTKALAEICARVLRRGKAKKGARSGHHPATVPFQALRIAVNNEFQALEQFLAAAPDFLAPGGRLLVISFHSLEDKLVAGKMRQWSRVDTAPRGLPSLERPLGRLLTRKAVEADPDEIRDNPRARSARLRVFEREREAA